MSALLDLSLIALSKRAAGHGKFASGGSTSHSRPPCCQDRTALWGSGLNRRATSGPASADEQTPFSVINGQGLSQPRIIIHRPADSPINLPHLHLFRPVGTHHSRNLIRRRLQPGSPILWA